MMTQMAMVVLILLLISSCSFLPAPLAYLNYARTGFDVKQVVTGEPTTSDVILSSSIDMDCRIFNVLDGKDICVERPKE